MNSKLTIGIAALLLSAAITASTLFLSAYSGEETTYLYLYDKDQPAQVKDRLSDIGVHASGFHLLRLCLPYHVRPGRYAIQPGENILTIFRNLRNGHQEPVNLVLPSVRTLHDMAAFLGEHLMVDSAAVDSAFYSPEFAQQYGYSVETLPALFIPNTYQVYWNISLPDFMARMVHENEVFWSSADREAKAQATGFTHEEICTIASIVDSETANNAEKPMVAGMYIRRLQIDMPLQADPTVKFAVGDFSIRRILHTHLEVESPYNTYKNVGLPPGPICIATIAGIDAVLNYVHHNYIYMCAKEDFSGTHNFATNYNEHLRNAHRYARALNERGIK